MTDPLAKKPTRSYYFKKGQSGNPGGVITDIKRYASRKPKAVLSALRQMPTLLKTAQSIYLDPAMRTSDRIAAMRVVASVAAAGFPPAKLEEIETDEKTLDLSAESSDDLMKLLKAPTST